MYIHKSMYIMQGHTYVGRYASLKHLNDIIISYK